MSEPSDISCDLLINKQRLNCLLEELGDEVVQRLFGLYRTEMTEKLVLISGYLDQKAFAALECESHALKSASQNLGIDQMGEIMAEIEKAAIAYDQEKARVLYHQAVEYYDVVEALDRLG